MKYDVILDRDQMTEIVIAMKSKIEQYNIMLESENNNVILAIIKEDITKYKTIINAIYYAIDNETVII